MLATAPAAFSAGQQSLAAIRTAVRDFVLAEHSSGTYPAEVRVGRLDQRLRLGHCTQPLALRYSDAQRRTGSTYVGVRCEQPAWRIFVPVSIDAFADVLVAARALPRGHRLQAGDVRLQKRKLTGLRNGYYTDPGALAQLEVRRPLAAGTVLAPGAVAPRKLVRNGETVTLVAERGALRVRMRGKALADAARGATVRVRNSASGRVVEGRVTGPGEVAVR